MNRKFLSVFLSVLMGSTLAHESLKAHELSGHHKRAHPLGFHQYKAATLPPSCSYICPLPPVSPEFPSYFDTELLNIGGKILAFVNTSSLSTISFQIGQPMALLVNGKTGVTIYIDIAKGEGLYFRPNSNNKLWLRSQILFTDYLEHLGSLNDVLNWKHGQSFKLKSTPKEIASQIINIINDLAYQISKVLRANPDSLEPVINHLINGYVKGADVIKVILAKLKSEVTIVLGGINKFLNLVLGLHAFKDRLPNGIQSLQDLIIDGEQITLALSTSSGLEFFALIEYHLIDKVSLPKILGNSIDTPEKLLKVSVEIDGGSYVGISGITEVLYSLILYKNGKLSLESLIDIWIQVAAASTVKIPRDKWNTIIDHYLSIIKAEEKGADNNQKLSAKKKFFEDIKNGKLIIGKVNASALINILIETSGNVSMNNLLKVLLELKAVISIKQIIATLYFRLIWFIVTGQGILVINALLPSITIIINFSSKQRIVKQILSKVQVSQLTPYVISLDIVGVITHLPVFGPIFVALETSLKAVGVVQVTLKSALKENGHILIKLKNWIWFGIGFVGGSAPSGGGIAGLGTLDGIIFGNTSASPTVAGSTESGITVTGGGGSQVSVSASGSFGSGWSFGLRK